jgi:hypothetical protein
MAGGDGNILPADNPKPFTKKYNYKDFEKWTEDACHEILEELEDWLLEELEVEDKHGNFIRTVDSTNCFYKGFIYKKGLMEDWVKYVKKKFDSVKKRFKNIEKIQEYKLLLLAATGRQKESITKLILSKRFNYVEKTESKNENTNTDIIWNESRRKK